MAYSDATATVVSPSNSVFLMTATLKNTYHPFYQPVMLVVNVEKVGAKNKSDRLNFLMDKQAKLNESSKAQATVRERTGNEFKAGPSLPLIDQAIAGASGGIFDVDISDRWDTDESVSAPRRLFRRFA